MKSYSIFLILILICKNSFESETYGKDNDLCNILYEMYMEDQKYRATTGKISDHYPNVLDSLIFSKGFTKTNFSSLPENQQGELKKQALKLAARKLKPLMVHDDSLRVLQQKLDVKNTEKLIEITKKRGWLTAEGLGCRENFKTVLIFRHAPKKYWKEIRALIEKERMEKRLSGYEHYIIDNHLKGRPPLTKKSSDFVD